VVGTQSTTYLNLFSLIQASGLELGYVDPLEWHQGSSRDRVLNSDENLC